MRSISFIMVMLLAGTLLSQPAIDGFMRGKNNLDIATSVTYETYSQYFSKLNNKVSVKRSAIPVSLYAAYGISNRFDVQISIPYVYTVDELSGMQDFSIYFKGAALDKYYENGNNLKLMFCVGGKIPMSNYETQSVNSIGQADTAVDVRFVIQHLRSDGFFMMLESGYTHRLDPVPSSYAFALKVGWARGERYIDIWYDQQWAVGGNDYQDWRDGQRNLSFRTFGVSYGKLGLTYYKPFGKSSGFSSTLSYVLWGRNIGQAVAVSLGYIHRIKLSKK